MTHPTTNILRWSALLLLTTVASGCALPTLAWRPTGWGHYRSMAIPDSLPLGVVNQAHYHTMETNAEAVDFILHRHEFTGATAALTPEGRDHVMEIAARMRTAPFPVIVERSDNNSDPELDAHRRQIVVQMLTDFGNPDAYQRTLVSQPYSNGYNSWEGEIDYYNTIFSRGGQNNNNTNGGGLGGSGAGSGVGGGGFGF